MKTPVRVAITGAAGQIGYQLAFRIASGQMLGTDQPVILRGHLDVEFTSMMKVLDACQAAGIWNVAFAAMKMEEEDGGGGG